MVGTQTGVGGDAMPNNMTVELPDLSSRTIRITGQAQNMNALPMRGITILAVEDSRFASEVLRLMCRRLGARLRRAESIQAARSHLRLYRPNLVIIDLGLPDGRGEALIREIVVGPHAPIVLGMSGDPSGRALALAAGAEGFLDKPLESLAAFQGVLTRYLPDRIIGLPGDDAELVPDTLALRDDLAHALSLIDAGITAESHAYLTGFLNGVARHAHDTDLVEAVGGAGALGARMDHLRRLLDRRLDQVGPAFGTAPPSK